MAYFAWFRAKGSDVPRRVRARQEGFVVQYTLRLGSTAGQNAAGLAIRALALISVMICLGGCAPGHRTAGPQSACSRILQFADNPYENHVKACNALSPKDRQFILAWHREPYWRALGKYEALREFGYTSRNDCALLEKGNHALTYGIVNSHMDNALSAYWGLSVQFYCPQEQKTLQNDLTTP